MADIPPTPTPEQEAAHKANNAAHVFDAGKRAVKTLLRCIGEDPDRPGLAETPERVMKAWRDAWGAGYAANPDELVKLFDTERALPQGKRAPMVVLRDINFFSTCEHHMAPFFGTADVCYIPESRLDQASLTKPELEYLPPKVIGLSKLARIVTHFAQRLQVQERLNQEVAGFLAEHLSPHVAVRMRARHMCMMSRGVHQHQAETATLALAGDFYDDALVRQEMMMHLGAR